MTLHFFYKLNRFFCLWLRRNDQLSGQKMYPFYAMILLILFLSKFDRDYFVVLRVKLLIRLRTEKLLSTDADVAGIVKIKLINLNISGISS
jgi:hypothetical protein